MKRKIKTFFLSIFLLLISPSLFICEDFSLQSIVIPLPPRRKISFFSSIDESILELFEDGSVESLTLAVSKLKKRDSKYSDAERVLLYIAKNIMEMCWSSEKKVSIPDVSISDLEKNIYVGAIDFAKNGIYDFNAGNFDVLSLTLPSLVLALSLDNKTFFEESEKSLKDALEMKRDSVLVNFLLGILYEKQEKFIDACKYFEIASKSNAFEISYRLSENYLKINEFQKSLSISESLFSSNSFLNEKLLKLCADATFELDDLDSCENYIAKILQNEPTNRKYVLLRAKILIFKKDYIRASSVLDFYSRYDDNAKDYLLLRAKLQKEWNKNPTLSAFILEKAFNLYPNDIDVLLACAELCSENEISIETMNSGDFSSKILLNDSQNKDAIKIQIQDFVKKEEWNKAYNLSSSLMPDENLVFTHIDICIALKKNDEAKKLINEIYTDETKDEKILQSYLKVLIATSQTKKARKFIQDLMDESSQKMKSFLYYEKSLIDTNEDLIFEDLRLSLSSNPRNKDSLYRLYSIYYKKKEYRKSQYYLKLLFSLSPNDSKIKKLNENLDAIIKNGR